jgi:hypothetical protein
VKVMSDWPFYETYKGYPFLEILPIMFYKCFKQRYGDVVDHGSRHAISK